MEMEALTEMFVPEKPNTVTPDKRYEQNRDVAEEWDSSRDGSHPGTPLARTGKRKASECDRQPESPPEIERQHAPNNWHREKHYRSHQGQMDTDSPASYPKTVMVPESRYSSNSPHHSYHDTPTSKSSKVSTPVLMNDQGGQHGGYDHPLYRPSSGSINYYSGHEGQYQGHTPPRDSSHYLPDMETSPHYGTPNQTDIYMRPRRWACDYCNVATFSSYEEACGHEEQCARKYYETYGVPPHQSRGPIPQYDRSQTPSQQGAGLGALYHASQEMAPPPVPTRHPMWNASRGPPIPHLPHESHQHGGPPAQHHHQSQQYPSYHQQSHHHYHNGYHSPPRYPGYRGYDNRESVAHGLHGHHAPHHGHHDQYNNNPQQKRMLLAMPTDSDSLSDRQCYVRSEMVEIFAATAKDVAARHSKGAQKLVEGQVGIRCVHCSHLRPRDRAERAVCYPSSISRIYQTVADMQRFHFEQCREIPVETRKIYKTLKTTRPRGVGSPQTYWVQSAKLLDLVDSGDGIRFAHDLLKEEQEQQQLAQQSQQPQEQQQSQEQEQSQQQTVEASN